MDRRPLSALCQYLRSETRVWVRLGAHRPDEDWVLSLLEVTTGEPPPGWRRVRWLYPRAALVAVAPAGTTVAGWLQRGRVPLPGGSISLKLDEFCHVERRDSNFEGIYERLEWPVHEWTGHVQEMTRQPPHDELVAADAPAFLSFDRAAASLFCVALVRNRNFSGQELVVRQQDRRARIESVLVQATGVVVALGGDRLHGASIALGGVDGASKTLSSRSRTVRLTTPSGLGEGAWLALHSGEELLDRRILDPAWHGQDIDVEIDAPTRVRALISGGEGATVEFKRQLPGSDPGGVMKTVAAFASGNGGVVLFGVENDGSIVGLGEEWTAHSLDRLTNMVRDWVRPLPAFEVELIAIARAGVIALSVSAGADAPYGVGTTDRDVRYYVRRAGTTFPASPSDVRAFVHARLAVPHGRQLHGSGRM